MRKIVLILIAVLLLCACASNASANQKTAALTATPTNEPTASPVPENSGYFDIHTTKKIDAFGTVKREVKELIASNKATLASGGYVPGDTIYFIYDELGSRWMKNSFFICIIDKKLSSTYTDDRNTVDDYLDVPNFYASGNKVQYKIDDQKYEVTYDKPYVLRNTDFDRIYAALMDGKDVDFSFHNSGTLYYVFTVHGIGFSDLVSSIQ